MQPLFRDVLLSITAAGCRNRCRHCSIDAKVSDPVLIPYEPISAAVEVLRAENRKAPPLYERVRPFLMYEPMDHRDIVNVHKLFRDLNPEATFVSTIPTNGQRIAEDPQYVRLICDLQDHGVRQFQLALHGLETTHDWFAGRRGAYSSIMEAARRIASVGVKIDWVYFLSKRNIGEFAEMIECANEASAGTTIAENVNIWGPAGRAGKQGRILVTSTDLEQLPTHIRAMESLPEYLPECTWLEHALSGRMSSMLLSFRQRAREAGGIPDCKLYLTRDNIADFPKMLKAQRDLAETRAKEPMAQDPTESQVRLLAEEYGDAESKALYRVSTMFQEWRRRERVRLGE